MLIAETKHLTDNLELHVIDIEKMYPELEKLLDEFLVSICEGDSESELGLVKLRFKKFLETKSKNTLMGAIAEFFVHLYLRTCGYKQEFLFFNLEEGSIKKGFDGYFSKDNETYIVESKSGAVSTLGIKHEDKLKEAYNDIDKYVAGKNTKGKNNPWKNAYNHASHIDVGTTKTIRKKIKELSDSYDLGIYKKIDNFNVVPCSTIYLENNWDTTLSKNVLNDCEFIKEFRGKSIKAICITKKSFEVIDSYLGL